MRIAFSLLATGAFALAASAPQTVISVDITNPHDKPVVNAAVIVDFKGSHQISKLGKRKPVHWEVHTDEHGHAVFPAVPQGDVELQVIAKDYQTFGQIYDVETEQKNIEIQLNPPQDQYSAHPPLKPANPQ